MNSDKSFPLNGNSKVRISATPLINQVHAQYPSDSWSIISKLVLDPLEQDLYHRPWSDGGRSGMIFGGVLRISGLCCDA